MRADQWAKLEELFQTALAEAPEKRAAFLSQACGDDLWLHREVESMLRLVSDAGSFLEGSPISRIKANAPLLAPGQKLGHFEIVESVGRGGMGEVYRARDTRLKREVAIKVLALPAGFAGDAEFAARLESEAHVLASLNHPHIAAIYGLEESNGVRALAMEYVKGPTLAERIAHGRLPLDEALTLAKQMAEALEYSHEKGIVHRDLKPANVKVTLDGQVKVLDFGLAKVVPNPAMSANSEDLPTLTIGVSGVILGTPAYMAPEQACGRPVDKRADIWAFGVILYEMLSGKRLFQRESVSETLAASLKNDTNWNALPDDTPNDIRRLLRRCVERDPKQRLRDIGDARIAIEECLAEPQAETSVGRTSKRGVLLWLLAGALAIALIITLWAPRRVSRQEQGLVRMDVDLGSSAVLDAIFGASVILSPDGKRLVFISTGPDGQRRLSTRRLDQSAATPLAGTEGGYEPFFSPDSAWVGFFTRVGRKPTLKKAAIDGGGVITVCDAPGGHGASWSDDGSIIAALDWNQGLSKLAAVGGTPKRLTELNGDELSHRWPQVLPGGKAVLFTAYSPLHGSFDEASIDVQSLENGKRKILQRRASYGRYVPGGHLIFVHDGALFAAPMDLDRLEVTGTPTLVLEDVEYVPFSGGAQFDFARTGTLIYGKSRPLRYTLQWLDRSGMFHPLPAKPGGYEEIRLSPDGKRLALSVLERWQSYLAVYDLERDTMTRLTVGSNSAYQPVWTPDGKRIAFVSRGGIYWTRADGDGGTEQLTQGVGQSPHSFTPDGKRLAFTAESLKDGTDIWTVALRFDASNHVHPGNPELFLSTPANELYPKFSADGHWLAYMSDDSGTYEIFVRPFPGGSSGSAGKWQISNGGGWFPIWSQDGRELFFQTADNRIMVAACAAKGELFQASKPRPWSGGRFTNLFFLNQDFFLNQNFDVLPDGKRSVVILPAQSADGEDSQGHEVSFILNMFDELNRKVPLAR